MTQEDFNTPRSFDNSLKIGDVFAFLIRDLSNKERLIFDYLVKNELEITRERYIAGISRGINAGIGKKISTRWVYPCLARMIKIKLVEEKRGEFRVAEDVRNFLERERKKIKEFEYNFRGIDISSEGVLEHRERRKREKKNLLNSHPY